MVGDINAPRVIIVAGASFRGRVEMGERVATSAVAEAKRPREKAAPIAVVQTIPEPKVARGREKETAKAVVLARPAPPPPPARSSSPAIAPKIAVATINARPAPPAPLLTGGKRQLRKR